MVSKPKPINYIYDCVKQDDTMSQIYLKVRELSPDYMFCFIENENVWKKMSEYERRFKKNS